MELTAFYDVAKDYVDKLKQNKPNLAAEEGAEMCLLLNDSGEIFSGVTGTGICGNNLISLPAECIAVTALFATAQFKARQLVLISLDDLHISVPCSECLEMLLLLDRENVDCQVMISDNKSVTVQELMEAEEISEEEDVSEEEDEEIDIPEDAPVCVTVARDDAEEAFEEPVEKTEEVEEVSEKTVETSERQNEPSEGASEEEPKEPSKASAVNFFSGFGDAPSGEGDVFEGGFDESYSAPQHAAEQSDPQKKSSLGEPIEFASAVNVDESNPFYEAPSSEPVAAVSALNETTPGSADSANISDDIKDSSKDNKKKKSKSPEELLKEAKKKKKVAKANFNFFKKKQL